MIENLQKSIEDTDGHMLYLSDEGIGVIRCDRDVQEKLRLIYNNKWMTKKQLDYLDSDIKEIADTQIQNLKNMEKIERSFFTFGMLQELAECESVTKRN